MPVQNNLISAWRDSSNNIYVATATNQNASWSSTTAVGATCQADPAVVLFYGTYYVAYAALSTNAIMVTSCRRTTGSMKWSKPVSIGQTCAPGTSPVLAVFGTTLYMTFVAGGSTPNIMVVASQDGSTWVEPTSGGLIGQTCAAWPGMTVWNGKLWIAYQAPAGSAQASFLYVVSSADGKTWSSPTRIGIEIAGAPSMAAWNGALWIAFKSAVNAGQIQVTSCSDGYDWTSAVSVGQSTSGSPALAAFDAALWIAFTANNSGDQILYTTSSDGKTWTGNVSTGKATPGSPALAATTLYQGMLLDTQYTKTFSDTTYVHTANVLHQGSLVAFAMDTSGSLYYSILNFDNPSITTVEPDADYWSTSDAAGTHPAALAFPTEIRRGGLGSFGQIALQAKSPTNQPTTAQYTDVSPFEVLSDGTYIYLFRRCNQDATTVSNTSSGVSYTFGENSLLLDRFSLSGTTLSLLPEIRFQRSRSRDFPANDKDSLSPSDMNNVPFVEPTHELAFVHGFKSFAVALVPTSGAVSWRWQILAHNTGGWIDSFSVLQGSDGLLDFAGALAFACSNPNHVGVGPLPGTCGQPCGLQMVSNGTSYYCPVHIHNTTTSAGYCSKVCGLTFAQIPAAETADSCIALGSQVMADLGSFALLGSGGSFTVELWCQLTTTAACTLLYQNTSGGFELDFDASGALVCGTLATYDQNNDNLWHHYALCYDGTTKLRSLYKDGILYATDKSAVTVPTGAFNVYLGAKTTTAGTTAPVAADELRFWNVALSTAEIQTNLRSRVVGTEHALAHYFRFDEGSGTTLHDSAGSAAGTVHNPKSAAFWAASGAPLGQASGVRYERFWITPFGGNLDAELYYQQEMLPSPSGGAAALQQTSARMMLAFDTAASGASQVGVVDFAVGADGQLAQAPDVISLPALSSTGTSPVALSPLSMDGRGLTVSGGTLPFTAGAAGAASPTVYNSVTGATTLYWNGATNQLTWAGFDTTVVRAQIQVSGSNPGTLLFSAKTAGANFNDVSVSITQPSGSTTLTVTLTHGSYVETWTGVPVDALSFAAVLDAQPLPVLQGTDANGNTTYTTQAPYVYSGQGAQVTTTRADADLSLGSLIVAMTAVPFAPNTTFTVTPTSAPVTCTASGGTSGVSAAFAPTAAQTALWVPGGPLQLASVPRGAVSPTWDLSLEAWVNPVQGGPQYLLSQSSGGTSPSGYYLAIGPVVSASANGVTASIVKSGVKTTATTSTGPLPTGQWSHVAATFHQKGAVNLDGLAGYLDCGNDSSLSQTNDLTIEAWVQLTSSASTVSGSTIGICSKGLLGSTDPTGATVTKVPYALYIDKGTLMFAYSRSDGSMSFAVGPAFPTDGAPHSVAVTRQCKQSYYDSSYGELYWDLITFYVDGSQKAQLKAYTTDYANSDTASIADQGENLVIGWVGPSGVSAGAASTAYGAAAGNSNNSNYIYGSSAYSQLKYTGTAGLVSAPVTLDAPVVTFAGRISEVHLWSSALTSGQVCVPLSAGESGPAAWWTFEERQGVESADLAPNNPAPAAFMNGVAWDQSQDPTMLASGWSIYVNGTLQTSSVVTDSFVPGPIAQLWVGGFAPWFDGQLAEVRIWGMQRTVTQILDNLHCPLGRDPSSGAILDNPMSLLAYYTLDSVAAGASTVVDRATSNGAGQNLAYYAPYSFTFGPVNAPVNAVTLTGSFTVELWYYRIQLGENDWIFAQGNTSSVATDQVLTIGFPSVANGADYMLFGFDNDDLHYPYTGLGWHHWAFVYNRSQGTHGTRQIYLDGVLVASDSPTGYYGGGSSPAGIGYSLTGGNSVGGYVCEVRVWNVARQQSDIAANMTHPLTGSEANLEALWHLVGTNTNTTAQGFTYAGAKSIATQASTAPVGAEMPEAWSGLGAAVSSGCAALSASPLAVAEYGVNEVDARGNMSGALKRCYGLLQRGQWLLTNGLKVGPLVVQWVGQVQYNPTLIGYIEGAPPVPGENMIQPSVDYRGQSSVSLSVADSVSYTYTANRDKGFNYSTTDSFGLGFATNTEAGVGVLTEIEEADLTADVNYSAEGSLSSAENVSPTTGLSQSQLSTMSLDGYYFDAGDGLGPRFVPRNVGYALVKSGVADQYALRLASTGAVIGYQLVVNPNIPPDWNIITFQINPYYIRQGCLDGQFGNNSTGVSNLMSDPHFPAAGGAADASYFRVNEAYALKSKIVAQQQQLANQYASYDAVGIGNQSWVDVNLISANLSSAAKMTTDENLDTLSPDPTQLINRNLCNTYLWTAYGGLFAETEQTLDGFSESWDGSYSFSSMAGVTVAGTFANIASTQFSLSAMFGGHVDVTVTKAADATTDFGVDVSVGLDRTICVSPINTSNPYNGGLWNMSVPANLPQQPALNINQYTAGIWNPNVKPEPWDVVLVGGKWTELNQPQPLGGLVDAYRFMTFYLAPQSSNTTEFWSRVVNPLWLQSTDPNAVALREAQQGQGATPPSCWRVLHRVTFVSRVQPATFAPVSPESPVIAVDPSSHYLLIKQLEPYVRGATSDWPTLQKAVTNALTTVYGTTFPALTQGQTPTQVAELMAGYYGVTVPS